MLCCSVVLLLFGVGCVGVVWFDVCWCWCLLCFVLFVVLCFVVCSVVVWFPVYCGRACVFGVLHCVCCALICFLLLCCRVLWWCGVCLDLACGVLFSYVVCVVLSGDVWRVCCCCVVGSVVGLYC